MAKWEEDNLGQAHSTYGLHKAQISCSLPLHQTFNWKIRLFTRLMSPILAKEMPLSSQPHLMHITAFWTTVVHNCFQGGSAVKTKPHPKSLKNTLISLRMTSTQTDSCISFTKSHISQVLWLCWPPFHVLTKKY